MDSGQIQNRNAASREAFWSITGHSATTHAIDTTHAIGATGPGTCTLTPHPSPGSANPDNSPDSGHWIMLGAWSLTRSLTPSLSHPLSLTRSLYPPLSLAHLHKFLR